MGMQYTALGHYVNVTGLAMCITDRLADTPAGVPARVCIYPGSIAWDGCDCGLLALTTNRLFASETFPSEGIPGVGLSTCGLPYMVAEIEIDMIRCVPGVKDKRAPTCEELATATQTMYEDSFAVWQGVICCLKEMKNQGFVFDYAVAAQTFVGPQGQCAGSNMTISLGYIGLGCC